MKKWWHNIIPALLWGAIVVVLATVAVTVFNHRDHLAVLVGYTAVAEMTGGVRFFRDFLVAYTALIGVGIAIWRAIDLNRQTKTGEERLLRERFATAAELMAKEIAGTPAIAARISGISIMEELANQFPEQFLQHTIKNMVAYIKDNAQITAKPKLEKGMLPDKPRILGEDVKASFAVIDRLCAQQKGGHASRDLFPGILDFSYADFSHLKLSIEHAAGLCWVKNWQCANLVGTDLSETTLWNADFRDAELHGAYLVGTHFGGANLERAKLYGATLRGAFLQNPQVKWSGAVLRWALFERAHLDVEGWDVSCLATDFTNADIKKGPALRNDVEQMSGGVWKNLTPALAHVRGIDGQSWCLEHCPNTSALVGAFRNFSEHLKPFNISPRAESFRKAAMKLVDEDKLPSDFPREWAEWLKNEIKNEII